MAADLVTRVKHAVRFRRTHVLRVETLSPQMRRVVLGGDDLEGFTSPGFDDHVKLFFPAADGSLATPVADQQRLVFPADATPPARDYTPRRFDAERRELTIDFGLHGQGPATAWARAAAPGAVLGIGGPRGSMLVNDALDWYVLAGDDTALPAIGRCLEGLPETAMALAVIEVDSAVDEQVFDTEATVAVHWVHREAAGPSIDEMVAGLTWPEGDGFAWVAGEASMARRLRQHLIGTRGLAAAQVKAAAYWRLGGEGKHEVLAD